MPTNKIVIRPAGIGMSLFLNLSTHMKQSSQRIILYGQVCPVPHARNIILYYDFTRTNSPELALNGDFTPTGVKTTQNESKERA